MNSSSHDFLFNLISCGTPSGFEDAGQRLWMDYVSQFPTVKPNISSDSMGNCWASTKPLPRPYADWSLPEIMIVGHCDEIGLMVTEVGEKGYLSFAPVGGVDIGVLQGSRVLFHSHPGVMGVIGRQPIHLQDEDDDDKKKIKCKDLWIDIGAKTKAEAEDVIPVGTVAFVERGPALLLNKMMTCRGLDDKLGAFVSAEVVRLAADSSGYVVTGVSTVQEEIGLCGAKVVAERLRPSAAIVVDVGFATDTPDDGDSKRVGNIKIGEGPALHIGAAINRKLNACLMQAAEVTGIKVQTIPEPNETGTDADSVRLSGIGIPTANVSIPVRYMHTPVEVCSLDDVEKTALLIHAACELIAKVETFDPWEP